MKVMMKNKFRMLLQALSAVAVLVVAAPLFQSCVILNTRLCV